MNLKKRYPVICAVDALGLAGRIELTKSDGFTPDRNLVDAIFQAGLNEDIEAGGKQYGVVLDVG